MNGSWRFRLSPTEDDSFAEPGFDADGWAEAAVPGAAGRGHRVGPAGPPGGVGSTPRGGAPVAVRRAERPAHGERRLITLGPASFDVRTGALKTIGGVDVTGLRLDVWRAPTDNDAGAPWQPDLRYGLLWRKYGLHRMRHRLDAVEVGEDSLTVRTRVAPAAWEIGLNTVYRWTSGGTRLKLTVSVTPDGDWTVPLPG